MFCLQSERLNDVQLMLPAQQAQYLAELKRSVANYGEWDTQQRQQYCKSVLSELTQRRYTSAVL